MQRSNDYADHRTQGQELSAVVLLKPRELAQKLGVGLRTLHRLKAQGVLPQPMRIGTRLVRWRASEIDSWIAAGMPRHAESRDLGGRP